MIKGHKEVTCWGDIRIKMTRKQRKTADCTAGDVGIVLRLSAKRSKIGNRILRIRYSQLIYFKILLLSLNRYVHNINSDVRPKFPIKMYRFYS